MNENTAPPNSNCPSGCEPKRTNDKHDADMKLAADHKIKAKQARKDSADKNDEKNQWQKV